jgi:hypothetical protein
MLEKLGSHEGRKTKSGWKGHLLIEFHFVCLSRSSRNPRSTGLMKLLFSYGEIKYV